MRLPLVIHILFIYFLVFPSEIVLQLCKILRRWLWSTATWLFSFFSYIRTLLSLYKQGNMTLVWAGLSSSEPPWMVSSSPCHCHFRKLKRDVYVWVFGFFFIHAYTIFNFYPISYYIRSHISSLTSSMCLKNVWG